MEREETNNKGKRGVERKTKVKKQHEKRKDKGYTVQGIEKKGRSGKGKVRPKEGQDLKQTKRRQKQHIRKSRTRRLEALPFTLPRSVSFPFSFSPIFLVCKKTGMEGGGAGRGGKG